MACFGMGQLPRRRHRDPTLLSWYGPCSIRKSTYASKSYRSTGPIPGDQTYSGRCSLRMHRN
jgi:hypothetical protein